jgi:hypothetical protein
MKKTLSTVVIFLMLALLFAIPTEYASLKAFLFGSEPASQYDNWTSHLAEGIANPGYNVYAPYDSQRTGFGDFRRPSNQDKRNWNDMLNLFVASDYNGAQAILSDAGMPYQVVEFHDTDVNRTYYMLREIPDTTFYDNNSTIATNDDEQGAFTYGWGLFIFNPAALDPIIITVPHPCDDFPSPRMGYEAFSQWNARYLMINGAGREVAWTGSGTYNNTKSLSDPTRDANHPFHKAYVKFADATRAATGKREFSAQIHTYDSKIHANHANCQISAGSGRTCPNLPIRDLSDLKRDLINQGDYLMVPAGTVEHNQAVYLNSFYSVYYSDFDFTFTDGENYFTVSNSVDLPAYSGNNQMIYTQTGTSDYDVYEPFFHIEMDELPNVFEPAGFDAAMFRQFYGWDEESQSWDMDNLFTNFVSYYGRWVEDMAPVLLEMFRMDDFADPTNPLNLTVESTTSTTALLSWDRSSSYDFETYEIFCDTEPIGAKTLQILDRSDFPILASQACSSITITGLEEGVPCYFMIRAVDKHGNYSALSNQVYINAGAPLPVELSSFTATVTSQSLVQLAWTTQSESSLAGYYLYRDTGNDLSDAARISSLITAANTSNEMHYNFTDEEVTPGFTYYYWLESVELDNESTFHGPLSVLVNEDGNPSPDIPIVTRLLAAYPNPCNPPVMIPYSIKTAETVKIDVFNLRGQLVWSDVRSPARAGYYRTVWNGKDLKGAAVSSGIYYYRMTYGRYSEQKKLILTK